MRRPLHVFRGPIGGAHIQKLNGRMPKRRRGLLREIFSPSAFNLNAVLMLKLKLNMSKKKDKLAGRTKNHTTLSNHGYTSDSYDAESKY